MRTKSFIVFLFLIFLGLSGSASADEGMWMLHSIKDLPWHSLEQRGMALTPEEFWNPESNCIIKAAINLSSGSASFVSPKGLIITNHHVAFRAIQKQATAEKNYIDDGFWAKTLGEEIPAKDYEAYVLLSEYEVTAKILEGVSDSLSDIERYKQIDKNTKILIEETEKGKDVRAKVSSTYEGLQYFLTTYFMIRDIRVVYAPPESIGTYGGDIDNWMWPRHTGDFAFMRAYVAPDGKSAAYSKQNVPYKPENYLKTSKAGFSKGDISIVLGYPYRTSRYRSSFDVDHTIHFSLPWMIQTLTKLEDVMLAAGQKDEAISVALASRLMMVQNYLKKNEGVAEGLNKVDLYSKKVALEKQTTAALEENKKAKEKFTKAIAGLDELYNVKWNAFKEKQKILSWMEYFPVMLRLSLTINKWSEEKQKDDLDREPYFMDRNIGLVKSRIKNAQRELTIPADKQIIKIFIQKALALPENQRIKAIDKALGADNKSKVSEKRIDKFIEKIFSKTNVNDPEVRLKMFDMSQEELYRQKDSFIHFAAELEKEVSEIREKEKAIQGAISKLRPDYIAGLLAGSKNPSYPDANRTCRFSFGEVKELSPRDAVLYDYQTTLTGIMEKRTDKKPFDPPKPLIEAFNKKDFGPYIDSRLNDVPVCFLTTNDGTGGNSGSPILNGKGEIIGLIFDTNFEAVASDYYYMPNLSRSINVDIRYALFLLDKVYGVQNVLDELEIR